MEQIINHGLYCHSCSFPAVEDEGLISLKKFSTEALYCATAKRLTALIEEATKSTFQYKDKQVEVVVIAHRRRRSL